MKISKISSLALLLVILSIFLSGCSSNATLASSWPGLSIDQETAYLAYNQQVFAINILNGSEIWRYPEKPNAKITFYALPALTSDNQLIIGGYNNILYSVNAINGNENWQFTNAKNRYIASPLVVDEKIYASNTDNTLYALGLQGNLLWTFETSGEQWAQPVLDPNGTKLYVSSMDHYLYAIDLEGNLIWKTQESLGGAIVGSPVVGDNDVLYIGSFGSHMYAINTQNGQVIWKTPTEDWIWSGPALKDNVVYFGDLNNYFYALDANNGSVLWRHQTDGVITGTPTLTDEAIYFGTVTDGQDTGTLYALDYQGNVKWTKTIEARIYQSPILAGDVLVLAPVAKDYILAGFDLNGNQKWTFTPANK